LQLNAFECVLKIRNRMKMTPKRNMDTEPLCKFGPGGDYIAVWQPEPPESWELSNCLVRLLACVAEVAALVPGLKRIGSRATSSSAFSSNGLTVYHKEKVKNAAENSRAHNTTDPAPTTATEDN
jgi:hypothetical protein